MKRYVQIIIVIIVAVLFMERFNQKYMIRFNIDFKQSIRYLV